MVLKVMLFPGTFDPFTRGHRDIARRASKLCDKLVIAVMENAAKKPIFTPEERVELIKLSLKNDNLDNVEVMAWGGLLVDLYQQLGCCYDAVLLPCRDDLSLISSSMVKEVGSYGGDLSKMVPAEILDLVKEKLLKGRN